MAMTASRRNVIKPSSESAMLGSSSTASQNADSPGHGCSGVSNQAEQGGPYRKGVKRCKAQRRVAGRCGSPKRCFHLRPTCTSITGSIFFGLICSGMPLPP
jgi:hypothetical protein